MGLLLKSAFLFFIGATCGWTAEVLFRRFLSSANPERKWINPGFCVGPYLPLYGVGLCLLYWIAYAGERCLPSGAVWGKVLLILFMGAAMTIMEYISGVLALKVVHVRLWDYSREWGNLQGIICPKFFAALAGGERSLLPACPSAYPDRAAMAVGKSGVFLFHRAVFRHISC